jgi:Fe-Mn family superoxide dismutase
VKFGSFDKFRSLFENAANKVVGSGLVWLCKDPVELIIVTSPNQENPLMNTGDEYCTPLLGLDVWEHAYYLDHMWERNNYISDFWGVVDWERLEEFYVDYVSLGEPIPV